MDSLKIEGRMKEPAYVANVTARYRAALDGRTREEDQEALKNLQSNFLPRDTFFHEDPRDLTNFKTKQFRL